MVPIGYGSAARSRMGLHQTQSCPGEDHRLCFPVACLVEMSVVTMHQAKTLRCWAYGGLGGQKDRERDHLVRGLNPFALNSKYALALRGLCPCQTRDHWPWNEFIHADTVRRQLLGQYPGKHPQPGLGARIGRPPGQATMPDTPDSSPRGRRGRRCGPVCR
jgi:hypothetical protein